MPLGLDDPIVRSWLTLNEMCEREEVEYDERGLGCDRGRSKLWGKSHSDGPVLRLLSFSCVRSASSLSSISKESVRVDVVVMVQAAMKPTALLP